jgi:nanoRNase/pAp phosphatase (c-di-AMP/oligoRNAs hydrolase)/glyoxylase-like metal-dependent hydrolase (beta-lactamase superfamily II)
MRCQTLFQSGDKTWYLFHPDAKQARRGLDGNVLVYQAGGESVLIDPGGGAVFPDLLSALTGKVDLESIASIVVSRQGLDVAASLPLWRKVCPRDVRIFASALSTDAVIQLDTDLHPVGIPDEGGAVPVNGAASLDVLPAPYLHAAEAVTIFDPDSGVLFSGDVGTAVMGDDLPDSPFVEDFDAHLPLMTGYHTRWMASDDARDAWLARVADLKVRFLVPRRGLVLRGDDVERFLDWFSGLAVGSAVPHGRPAQMRPAPSAEPPMSNAPDPESEAAHDPAGDISESPDADVVADLEGDDGAEIEPEALESFEQFIAAEDADEPVADTDEGLDDETFNALRAAAEKVFDSYDEDHGNVSQLIHEGSPDLVAESDAALLAEAADAIAGEPDPEADRDRKFRLITRSDFDGLVCAVLLEELGMIDDILFVHPKDMQDGSIPVDDNDITTNVPYVPGVHLAFDHHLSETRRLGYSAANHIINPEAPSAARVVYDYYGGKETFPNVSTAMMEAVDKADSAQFSMDEVLNPQGWELLNFIMDSRTGLGRFRGFRVPNYELMMGLIDYCRQYTIDEILDMPDVKERVDLYMEHRQPFEDQLKRCSRVHGSVVVLDLREEDTVYVGNRFMIYALFPQCSVSMHVMWGRQKQNVIFAVGKSIFDRSSKISVGDLMLEYGGGGHRAAGTCQAPIEDAKRVQDELIERIAAAG